MPNTYTYTRLEPLVTEREVNGKNELVIESIVVGMTAVAESGHSQYIDTMVATPLDPENFISFSEIDQDWALAIAEKTAEEKGWKESLDKQIEAAKVRPTPKPFSWQQPVEKPVEDGDGDGGGE